MRILNRLLFVTNYVLRRRIIFFKNMSIPKFWNAVKAAAAYVLGKKRVNACPVLIKIDVTPYCHLRCPICIHSNSDLLAEQNINKKMQMPFDIFKKLVDEIAGKTWILSLQHLGEPLFNKDLAAMCSYARRKKINTFFVSNFSVKLRDSQIKEILQSGVNWITVALDGFSQESYSKTRIGGSIALVKKNLENMLALRKKLKQKQPFIEVQSLIFKHNMHEKQKVIEFCKTRGVDKLTFKKGSLKPWIKKPVTGEPQARKKKRLPLCFWPYFSGVLLYDGNVIPCCWYRHENTYVQDERRITMGSITKNGFKDIYNNLQYQEVRGYCMNPKLLLKKQNMIDNFCYGCKRLFT
ncbi:MAG: SPASM domain-containing protein [Spirochaetales bacterium]|nr:SPASM domain-containing protein [Spirochaetales bacterium]